MAELVEDIVAGVPVIITYIAGADILAGQIVGMDVSATPAAMTVKPLVKDGVDSIPVGVATDSRANGADDVPVAMPPSVVRVRTNESESIKCGAFVGLSATAGEAGAYVANESEGSITLGQALEAIAEGQTGRVRLAISQ